MRNLITYFVRGLFYTVPVGLTVYVVVVSIGFLDHLIPFEVPGMGILTVVVLITLIGYLGSVVLASSVGRLIRGLEKGVQKIPGVKLIYTALKDLTSALVGSNRTFDHAVIVLVDKANGIEKIGFVTKENLEPLGVKKDKVAVYFPYSYGIMGDLRIVPKDSVRTLPGKPAEIMKFIVSGGVGSLEASKDSEKKSD